MRPKRKKAKELMALHETLRRSSDLKKRIYTIPELILITGISLQKIRDWNKSGLLQPSWTASDAQGSQPKSYYSTQDVIKALMIREMCSRGLTVIQVKKAEKNLRESGLRLDESVKYLLTNGNTACYASKPGEVVDILRKNKQMWLIPIDECTQELNEKLKSKLVG